LAANDPSVQKLTWLDFMPAETRAYVQKNMAEYDAGNGQLARPTLEDVHNTLRADVRLAGNPSRLKIAIDESTRQYDEQTKAIKQRDEEAVANAMRAGETVGWRYSDLPASVRASIPPKEVDNVLSYYQKRAKGDDTTSPLLYQKLAGNPAVLASMSDSAFFALRRELSEADFKHFANERGKLVGGGSAGANGPGDLNSQAIKQSIDDRLRMLGQDPTPKDGSSEAERVGGMRKFVNDYFLKAQGEAGKKFTDAEVVQHIDVLFSKSAEVRGWFSNKSAPMLAMKANDIPTAEADKIRAAFKRRGVDEPTDAQVLDIYWKRKTAK
jgi:soluble lytic murein transglycosylase